MKGISPSAIAAVSLTSCPWRAGRHAGDPLALSDVADPRTDTALGRRCAMPFCAPRAATDLVGRGSPLWAISTK